VAPAVGPVAPGGAAGLEDLWRRAAPQVLAGLVRGYGDFDAAEDALQEALLAAARQWPEDGVPADPTAWLLTVASRRLIDRRRQDAARAGRERADAMRTPADRLVAPAPDVPGTTDDEVTLFLLCCHPALRPPAQIALTLRALGGLSTAQIARAFLVPEATMAQRISRAKARLRQAGATLAVLPAGELPDRVAAVAHVLYLIFTEGHASSAGRDLYDVSLTREAIRLARYLHARLPDVGEITGLLALMLLTDARRAARTTADGSLVPLAEQDRSRWDAEAIREGIALVESALPRGTVGPYQLQAAIAAVHAEASRADATDWAQIDALYRMLERVAPGPVVTVNHAVAVAMLHGPDAGLLLLEPLLATEVPGRYHRVHAVRGHLLEMRGDAEEARAAYAAAAELTTSLPEQRYLNERAARLPSPQ
jgi:RNA polymerase sigma factor (sigma-70 family)